MKLQMRSSMPPKCPLPSSGARWYGLDSPIRGANVKRSQAGTSAARHRRSRLTTRPGPGASEHCRGSASGSGGVPFHEPFPVRLVIRSAIQTATCWSKSSRTNFAAREARRTTSRVLLCGCGRDGLPGRVRLGRRTRPGSAEMGCVRTLPLSDASADPCRPVWPQARPLPFGEWLR